MYSIYDFNAFYYQIMENVNFIEWDITASRFLLNAIRSPDVKNISGSETESDQLLQHIFFEIELWIEEWVKTIFITQTFYHIERNDIEKLYAHLNEIVEKFWIEFFLVNQNYSEFKL